MTNISLGADSTDGDEFATPIPDTIPTLNAAFLDRQLSFSNACRDDGMSIAETKAAGRLWMFWAGLDLRSGADEATVNDAIASFRGQCPRSNRALAVVRLAWSEIKAAHDIITLSAQLRAQKAAKLNGKSEA